MIQAAYVHIPFCEHICHYCDFNKVLMQGQPVDDYLTALEKEIKITISKTPIDQMQTIFVGGGTPTSLNEQQLFRLVEMINHYLPVGKDYEYTFEANPGDLTREKLQILKDAGVNRISLGVQTFNDELLKRIGRVHCKRDVLKAVEALKNLEFKNISIDLMFSLPGQTIADFRDTLKTAFLLDIPHYSAYSLIIEPKTVFYNLMKKQKLHTPGEDAEAEMYELLMVEMDKHGHQQYEISNFSRPGFESRHNLTYWNNEEYFGFGAGAHSYVNGWRQANIGPLKKYMDHLWEEKLPVFEKNKLTKAEQMEEEMFLGLRKAEGVSVSTFSEKFRMDPLKLFSGEINRLESKGWIQATNERIFLTKNGRLLGNEVFQSFLGVCND